MDDEWFLDPDKYRDYLEDRDRETPTCIQCSNYDADNGTCTAWNEQRYEDDLTCEVFDG